jgi:deazaflavin-dependent oxidoreductase (nitroreductase family)
VRRHRPGRTLRRLLKAPTVLYDWHLGWLLGHRFLRLTHIGRRSGRVYQTVLEVVGRNPAENEFIVVAGLGRSAHWYQNLQVHEGVEVAIAREHFAPIHRELPTPEAVTVLAAYERSNRWLAPLVQRALSWLVGWRYDGSASARCRLAAELPLIALRPTRPGDRRELPEQAVDEEVR